ncbi:MAG: DNA polymerase I [Myxococcales bacterium]|nr:DNA polymerase I [Myxococcales bacterium]
MERVVLIDGSALIYRAYFAIPSSFSTADGTPTNATYGFALMFRKLLAAKLARFGAVIFDAPGPTFRDERYPEYKAQRPSMPDDLRVQLPLIDEVVAAHRYPTLRVPGYEADDVIGTLTKQAVAAGHEVMIVSGDKDFAQLIAPQVRMLDPMRDVTYDEELVRKKWGVLASQFVDHLALMGDSSDGIPGVPGVGQKSSAGLLEKYGSLDGVYENLDALKGKQRENLETYRDQALLSRELATIDCAAPLPFGIEGLTLPPVDEAAINALYRRLEFNSLLGADQREPLAEAPDANTLSTDEAVRAWLSAHAEGAIAVAPVLDSEPPRAPALVGVALCVGGDAGYAPLSPATAEALHELLAGPRPKVVHHARDLDAALRRAGHALGGVAGDTALASFLVDPTKCIPHELERVAREYLQRALPTARDARGGAATFAEADPTAVAAWAVSSAVATEDLWTVLVPRLDELDARKIHDDVELPLSGVLARMSADGVRVLPDVLASLQRDFGARRAEVEARVHELAGHPFNLGSSKQLGEVLFDELKIDVVKRNKTGYSTAADVLERLAPKHEIAERVLEWRALDKLINTYTEVLQRAIDPTDGRVHATFQQTAGASGRLITTDPDLQRTPIRTDDGRRIREAFVPRGGWELISADWSQIELRVLAHCSNDAALLRAFNERLDLHRQTAASIFDVAEAEVTREQRTVGKTVNFATIYGQGATALGQQLGVPRKRAQEMIDRYFELYSGVRAWLDRTITEADASGYCETLLGRRRMIPELRSNNWQDRGYGERIAANTPIQGSAADICKLAMLQIQRELDARGLAAKMLVQIHDELLFEAPPAEVTEVVAVVRERMERCVELAVPLEVEVGVGPSWAAAH